MKLFEKRISSEKIYNGKIINLSVDQVLLPNGKTSTREVVSHNGAVCIVAIDKDNMLYMVNQFRYPFNCELLEIPAGKLDSPNEDPKEASIRELREETGLIAKDMFYLGEFKPSVAYLTEVIHMYLATQFENGSQDLDDDEFLDVIKIPFDEAIEKILNNEITDGKTIAALLKATYFLNQRG